jgi:glycosyltransferase involved in cell wall biosynthesis/ADP-heptose:LPS heptosyltransferase/radical SAM superfamily enzyme YgiQ (UPF0313 family)/predicted O-methyltransferase YrrM/2-polyprenyl-3-methyl-5-hydroxy-6-metoxy-1,4-benzoquinol methylase
MRILLISLPGSQGTDEPLFPLGIGYLVAVLKKEHQVKAAHYQKFEHVGPTLPDLINSFRPDLVGLTCTTFNRGNVRKIISVIKKYCPNIKVVVGGVHASFLYEQVLNGYGADVVVIGEGECTSLELCRALENGTSLDDVKGIAFKRAGSVVVTTPRPPIENLDELPMPDYDFAAHLMKISGMGFIITSRGCPVRCIFCSTSSYWGQKVRKSSVTRVVDEMEYLADRYKVRKIFFDDDTFNLGIERVKEICNEIMRRRVNIEWAVDCRVTPVSQEMVDMMAEAGCRHICWGVETGSETILKNIEKKITMDQIRNAYELTKKHSRIMSSGAFAMVGNHGETDQTIRETVEFFNTIPLTDHPSTAMLCLLPGTKIHFDMKSKGLVDDSIWMLTDEVPRTGEHSEATLHRWAQQVSGSGNMLPFDRKGHFWNNVLFGDVPKAQLPRFVINQSESQCETAYNTNNTNQNSSGEKTLPVRVGADANAAVKPPSNTIFSAVPTVLPAKNIKLKLLLVYSLHPTFGKVTLPEWIKEALRLYYSDTVEVFACGPSNEINVPDGPDFYSRVADVVKRYSIDVLWDIEGGAVSADFMFKRFPDSITIPKVFWAIDTHQFLSAQIEKSKHFDMVFSAQKNAVSALGPHAHWLPAGAAVHEKDYCVERTIEVGFIGNIFPGVHDRRKNILEYLRNTIPGFAVFNNVFLEEKAKLTSRMKIMINISLRNDVNFRVFETLACGALLITDKIYDNGLEDLFKDGEHLITFDSEQDLVEKINYYLKHEDERIRIAEAGKARVLSLYTHKDIVRKALDLIHTLVNEKHKHSEPAASSDTCWCGGALRDSVHPLYYRCELCGTHVVRRKYSSEELQKFYTMSGYWHEHQTAVFGYPAIEQRAKSDFNDRIPYWFDLVQKYHTKKGAILEIGCAHGGFLYYCRERGIQNVVGVEVDEETCRFARERFGLPHVCSGLFPDVKLPITSFDIITGFDVIEHFADPVAGITAVTKYLSDDGVFIFQTPCYRGEADKWTQFKPSEHIFLYNESSIKKLFLKCGLEITNILPGYFPDDMFVVGHKVNVKKNTGFSRLDDIRYAAKDRKAIENVLIVRPDAIGDFVIFSSILPSFRTLHPEARISILLENTVAQLAQNCPYIDEIITFKESQIRDAQYLAEVLAQLQSRHFDIAYHPVYSRSEIGDLLTLQSGAAKKVTFSGDCSNMPAQLKSNNDKNYDMLIPSAPGVLLETQRNREFMKGMGIDIPDSQGTCIWLNQKDDDCVIELLKGLSVNNPIVISPFARFGIKDWPIEKWAQLISHYPDENMLICGGPEDYERAQKLIMLSSHRHIYNLCGKTTLSQTAAIMGHCKLYVGVDTGPAHMAIAANIPNVVLMGGGHLGRFMPYSPSTTMVYCHVSCVGCNWRCKFGTKPAPCLAQISVPTVIKAITAAVSIPVSRRKEPLVIAEPLQTQTAQIAENSSLDRKPAKDAVSYELIREKINKVTGFLVQDDERFLFEVAKSLPDDATIVEIGSYKGRSTCCLAYACLGTRKKVYSIDICFANATGFAEWKENVGRNGLLDYVTPIAGNSKNIATQWDKGIDFIFIDGSHSYLPVLSDFIGFYPWVKDNGVIAFHDVGPGFTGPMRVWQENAKPLLYDTGLCGGIAFGRKIPVGASLNKTKPAEQLSIAKYHTRVHSLPPRHPLQVVEFDPRSKSHPVPLADTKSHKVLIVHTGSAGDVMLFMNLLHVYRKNYFGSHLAVCVEEKVADIVLPCPYIDEVITFNADAAQKDTGYLNQLASQISSRKFDVVIHPVYSRTQAGDFITLESGAKEKIGFDNIEGEIPPAMRSANNPLYTKLVSVFEPAMSETGKYDFFAHSLNMSNVEMSDPLWVTSDDITYVDNLLRTQGINSPIVIHPFSNDPAAQWPANNWIKLISHYKDYPVIITGRKEDREKGDALIRDLQQQNVYNMCGRLNLRQSAVLLHRARLCVTLESDEPHFACAVDCPNVVVTDGRQFGRYLPYNKITALVYAPTKCFNCGGVCGYPECFCITKLKVETVRKAIDEFLNGFPKDHLPLLPQIDSVSTVPYKSVYYRVEEIELVRDMYRRGLRLMQSNDIANAKSALEVVVNRLRPFMVMGVQWKTAGEGEYYYDTVKCYINACATLAQCYMQTGEFGKLKAVYQHLIENKILLLSYDQISAFRTVVAKLQKVEPDNSMFAAASVVVSQIAENPVTRPTETKPKYLISAIVSTYNAEKFIRGCLEDLENQTIADKLEIIVVDSGSQENEASIVKEFQQRYSNIKYIRTERETIYGAWNRAIKASSGKYITNANTDDRHYKDSLEKLVVALEQNPKKVIAYGNLHATSTIDGEITCELRSKQGGHLELLSGLFWLESQPMWRRDLHNTFGYFDEQFFCSGDYEFWIRATQRFEMLHVDIFTGKKLMNDTIVSLANKHMQSLENLIIAQSYEYAMQTREPIGKQGISSDVRLLDWPEIKVWKRLVAAKLSGGKWNPSDEMVDVKDMRTGSKPKLSVIAIETEATKWQCIQPLVSQSDQDFELILIAYRSLPSQSDLATFTGRICIVQLKDDIGAAFARNVGIAHAKGDFIACLDSSMRPNPGWVEAIFRQLTNPKMMAARGQIIDENDSPDAVITQSYTTFCSSADNCAFRKSVLLDAKGFDEDMFALESHELSYRICELANNALDVIMFEPGMLVRFDANISKLKQIIQKIRSSHMQKRLWRKHNDILGYIEYYHSQDTVLSWQYDNDYLRIIAIAVFLKKGHPELAMKWAQKAVALDPSRIKGRYILGSFYFEMGSYDKAATMLESVLLTQLQSLGGQDVSNSELERQTINADCCMSTGTMLAQCYMKKGQYSKLKKVYTLLLNSPHLTMPPEQRASIQALLVKLRNVEDVPVKAAAPQIDSSVHCPLKPEPCVNAADKKDEKYLVSAIVSTYNSETFIRGCLEDLENQTIADKLEIIVVNSGSGQNEESIVKEFQKKYGNIVYIKTEHEGLYSAWNRAIKAASGQFLTNANTDDRHRRDAFEIMANTLLENTDVVLVYGNQIITDTPNPSFENHHVIEMAKRPEFSRQRLLFGCCVGSQPMWRKSLHDEFGGFDETLVCASDWDFWLKIAQKYSFKHIDEFMGLFYRNENGIEHGREIHSLYERYAVGKRYGNPYISVIQQYNAPGSPLVSIIVTAYNAADYISRAIESILIQSYRNFEIIVVDDGSTDNTAEIVRGFEGEPIKYFFKENGGVASARNFGLQKAGGSFIIMLDSDDMMTPDYIASHLQGFEQHPEADMIYCDDLLIDEQDKPIRVINRPEYSNPDGIISDMFRCGFPVVHFKTCIKRSVFDKLGLYDERLIVAEDYDMMRRFVKQQLKMHHLPEALYLRRLRADSLSKGFNAAKAKSHFDVIRRFTETFTPEQLFPDVQWDKLPAEQKTMLTKCREALAYLGIGEQYIQSKAPDYAEAAFDMACEQLDNCCKIEPANQQVRNLREKCLAIRVKHSSSGSRGVYQTV